MRTLFVKKTYKSWQRKRIFKDVTLFLHFFFGKLLSWYLFPTKNLHAIFLTQKIHQLCYIDQLTWNSWLVLKRCIVNTRWGSPDVQCSSLHPGASARFRCICKSNLNCQKGKKLINWHFYQNFNNNLILLCQCPQQPKLEHSICCCLRYWRSCFGS